MNAYEYLVNYNIKPSVQRIAIMDYLLKHATHPCVDEIYTALCNEIPTLSKTTVYNTLKLFVEHGAVRMLTINEHNTCFDGNVGLHSHFLCKTCGKVFDIPFAENAEETDRLVRKGFEMEEIHHYYKGTCPDCVKNGQKEQEKKFRLPENIN